MQLFGPEGVYCPEDGLHHRPGCIDVFYVDVGAFAPSVDSHIYALYTQGWRGYVSTPCASRE